MLTKLESFLHKFPRIVLDKVIGDCHNSRSNGQIIFLDLSAALDTQISPFFPGLLGSVYRHPAHSTLVVSPCFEASVSVSWGLVLELILHLN